MKNKKSVEKIELKVWIVLLFGILLRVVLFGVVPSGINQDEAFAGYEAYSLLHYGMDSFGNPFPVYFVSWGSGMNVLNSYLMIPFLAVFGVHTWVVRLPQVIVACLSLYVFYRLLQRVFDKDIAFAGLLYLAVCPWHVMLSRWGLESNLAPGFLLFGLYMFVVGLDKPKYMIGSALFYGLSLYTYATIWTILPFLILFQIVYAWYTKKIKFGKYHLIAGMLLAVLAAPLILFMLVNAGYINEIRTAFFTIPKLVVSRKGEVSLHNIPDNFRNMMGMLLTQNDRLYWNSTYEWGLYFPILGIPFTVIGFVYLVNRSVSSIRNRKYDGAFFLILQFIMALVVGCLISVNVNRINCIHMWIIAFAGIGVCLVAQNLRGVLEKSANIFYFLLVVCGLLFFRFYITDYNDNIGYYFQNGVEEAICYADSLSEEEPIYVSNIDYPKVLLFTKMPADEYVQTVQYMNFPSPYLYINSCGRYFFNIRPYGEAGIFITSSTIADECADMGYVVKKFDRVAVLYK